MVNAVVLLLVIYICTSLDGTIIYEASISSQSFDNTLRIMQEQENKTRKWIKSLAKVMEEY